jgi:cellulose synthase/poly-beta-1,6-N-acetylglucosamine synthase-like glycosyltransferase
MNSGRESAAGNQRSSAEQRLTVLLLLITALASGMAIVGILLAGAELAAAEDWPGAATQFALAIIVGVLTYGFLVYFVTRLGYWQRLASHAPADPEVLESIYAGAAPALAVLVPSYKEETAVIRRTLLSAALQEYPGRHIVLLIDDPCFPENRADAAALEGARRLPQELASLFAAPAQRCVQAGRQFEARQAQETFDPRAESLLLARHYEDAAAWFDNEMARFPVNNHEDRLFADEVLTRWRNVHRERATRLTRLAGLAGIDREAARREHRRLATLFTVDFSSFEHKRYANLSREVNKAMNLNSYLALMGKSFRELRQPGGKGLVLQDAQPGPGTLDIPDASLILTLDADSVLLPDYALRLAHVLIQPGNERVAVVQTPYSAFPGAPGILERVAGATTDVQYLIHQGFSRYNATYWVGANALLRKAALEDICIEQDERGYRVRKYIQDRTVIEDTESSIDLADRGWTLSNYPERLAYSATPSDFGSLLIQRRRWANGGLIILPKALRYLCRGLQAPQKMAEAFCRIHYLTSIAAINVASLAILFGPWTGNASFAWLLAASLPYMYAYARDMVLCGYRWSDFPRVWALNLLLLPVHLGGVIKSLHQATTGRKTPFARTPKVAGRTAAPGLYVLAVYAFLAASLLMLGIRLSDGEWISGGFALACAAGNAYALFVLIGWRESLADLQLWLRPPPRPRLEPNQPVITD